MLIDRTKEVEFRLKVMINKQKTKVLFAEVDSDFADVLLSFLALPLGTIVRVLNKHYGDDQVTPDNIGSMTSLYNGLSNLDSEQYFWVGCKDMLVSPTSTFEAECRKLKLDISDTQSIKLFSCQDWNCGFRWHPISMPTATCTCFCGKTMNREVCLEESDVGEDGSGGVFTTKKACFIISDDLRMVPNVALSIIKTLKILGISDTDGAELRNLTFGFHEVMDLLKVSLLSRTPLTDLILKGQVDDFDQLRFEPGLVFNANEREATPSNDSKKMNLTMLVQKSNNKLLFAQAEDDFVDFLFSLLTIPLGQVECLLDNNTCLKSIDNLYKSIADLIDDEYLANADIRNRLMNPKLPEGYIPKNQTIPLSEQTVLYYHQNINEKKEWLSYSKGNIAGRSRPMLYQRCPGNYVKEGLSLYMVADDLTVTPMRLTSSLSILNYLNIPLSDVKEVEVHVGLQEALSILKASLTSTSALTDGLMNNLMLKKQLKQ